MSLTETVVKYGDKKVTMIRLGQTGQFILRLGSLAREPKFSLYCSGATQYDKAKSQLLEVVKQDDGWVYDNPSPGMRSYYHLVFEDEDVVITLAEREVRLEGGLNFRDLGGYATDDGRMVQWGKLFRSGQLSELTETGVQLAESLGIRWICDLRTESEAASDPSPLIGAARYTNLSYLAVASPEMVLQLLPLTVDFFSEANRFMVKNTEMMGAILHQLLEEDASPAVIHCAAGKDRTGFAIAVILQTLGIPRTTVMEDYCLSNHFTEKLWNKFASSSGISISNEEDFAVMKAYMEARPSYLHAAFDEIDARYNSFDNYLFHGLGITQERRTKLQQKFLI